MLRLLSSSKRAFCVGVAAALLVGLAVLGMAKSAYAQGAALHAISQKIDQHYDHLETLKADFTQSYAGNGIQRTESGTLQLKRPGRMRWDYAQPRAKLFLTDGKTAWFYVPGEQQAHKAAAKSLDDLRSPLRFLLGKTRLEKEFRGLSFAPDVTPLQAGDVVLRGQPQAMAARVQDVVIEASPTGQIQQLIVHETDGSTTIFRFTNQAENLPIAENVFRFQPPPGVEVVQANDLETPE